MQVLLQYTCTWTGCKHVASSSKGLGSHYERHLRRDARVKSPSKRAIGEAKIVVLTEYSKLVGEEVSVSGLEGIEWLDEATMKVPDAEALYEARANVQVRRDVLRGRSQTSCSSD